MNTAHKNKEKEDDDVPVDAESDFQHEEVFQEDEWSLTQGEEYVESAVKAIQDRAIKKQNSSSTQKPPAVSDFLRGFLFQTGMTETLNCFQSEWTEMIQKGLVDADGVDVVPDVYTENQRLERELKNARREKEECRQAVSVAAETMVRAQKARDLHRLQHKRVVQEKNRLIEEMRKVEVQYDGSELALKRMSEKYQAVSRQVVLGALALGQESRQSTEHDSPFCGGEEGSMDKTGEPSVRERPVTQPRPPASPRRPGRQNRVQSVKANVP
ncbi:sperm-associated antigen 16 protein-like [Stegastes partitus]|uniref:Sperm-associated antigen 16 protein-like n=1 Tax=Stegastes partitus TaxID=144197 RepID=A0A3B5ALJ7_9TELE|nr:PREDICTED: sperm-associated antigen 16 protein-like [Stegastes partitus]